MAPPQRLRDTLWAPALVQAAPSFKGMDLGEVLIPAIYPFSWKIRTKRSGWAESRTGRQTKRAGSIPPVRRFCWLTVRRFPSSRFDQSSLPMPPMGPLSSKTESSNGYPIPCHFAKISLLPFPVTIQRHRSALRQQTPDSRQDQGGPAPGRRTGAGSMAERAQDGQLGRLSSSSRRIHLPPSPRIFNWRPG